MTALSACSLRQQGTRQPPACATRAVSTPGGVTRGCHRGQGDAAVRAGCVPAEVWRAGVRATPEGGQVRGTGLVRAPRRGGSAPATGCPNAGAQAAPAWLKAAAGAGAALASPALGTCLSAWPRCLRTRIPEMRLEVESEPSSGGQSRLRVPVDRFKPAMSELQDDVLPSNKRRPELPAV